MSPIDLKDYPANWPELSAEIRFERAGNRCEGSSAYPDCRAQNGEPHPITSSKVVLTVAHLDHNKGSSDPRYLRAMCQRCHLKFDQKFRRKEIPEFRHYWRLLKFLPEYYRIPCRILARGVGGGPRNLLIEFANGFKAVSYWGCVRVRK